MRLASFPLADGRPRPGLIVGEEILDLSDPATGLPPTMAGLLALGSVGLRAAACRGGRCEAGRHDVSAVRRHAPVPDPPAILAIGMNYRAHVAELGREPPEWQVLVQQAAHVHRRARATPSCCPPCPTWS